MFMALWRVRNGWLKFPLALIALVAAPAAQAAEAGSIVWQLPLTGPVGSVALAPNGDFYVVKHDQLLAFDATGDLLWEHHSEAAPFQPVPMVLDNGMILVTTAGTPAAVRVVTPEGDLAWQLQPRIVEQMPALLPGGDLLLMVSWHSFTAEELVRIGLDGEPVWATPIPSNYRSSPSVRGDGVICIPGGWGLREDGSIRWSIDGRNPDSQNAAIGIDGTAYFGTEHMDWDQTGYSYLYAVGTDGAVRWRYPAGPMVSSPAILEDGSITFGTLDGRVFALSPAGALVWERDLGSPVRSSPAVTADGAIWIGSEDGRLHALEAEDGRTRWEWLLGGVIRSSPAIGPDGRVYITADDAGVFIVQGGAPPAASAWPMFRHDAARSARNQVVGGPTVAPTQVTAEEGFERGAVTVSWFPAAWADAYEIWRGDTPEESGMIRLEESVTGATRYLDRTGDLDRIYHYRVRARNAEGNSDFSDAVEAMQQTRRWTVSLSGRVANAPALASDGSLRVVVLGADWQPRLVAVDLDGQIQWQSAVDPVSTGPLVAPDGTTYLVSEREVWAVDAAGEIRWRTPLPPVTGRLSPMPDGIALTGDNVLVVARETTWMYGFDPDGTLLWTTRIFVQSDPVLAVTPEGGILVAGRPGVISLHARNGLRLWEAPFPSTPKLAVAADGTIVGAGSGRLVSASPTGVENWNWQYGVFGAHALAPVVGPDGSVYLVSPQPSPRLTAFRADGSVRWAITDHFTSSPTLLEDGTTLVYRRAMLSAYDADGTAIWEMNAHGPDFPPLVPTALSPLVTTDGTILALVGTNVVAFNGPAPLATAGWPTARRDPSRTANLSGPAPAPAPLTDLAASDGTWVNLVRLQWATNSDLAFVEIWRSSDDDPSTAVQVGEVNPASFEFRDRDVPTGEGFYYWLRARNPAGTTPYTASVRGVATAVVSPLWEYDAGTNLFVPALGRDGRIHVAAADGRFLTLSSEGTLDWSYDELDPPLREPAVALDGTVHIHNGLEFVALNPDGSTRWKRPLPGGPTSAMTIDWDGTVFLAQNEMVEAIDTNGHRRWERIASHFSPALVALGPSGHLHLPGGNTVDRLHRNGTPADSLGELESRPGPIAIATDGSLYFAIPFTQLQALTPDGRVRFGFGGFHGGLREPVLGPEQRAFVTSQVASNWRTYAVGPAGEELWNFASEVSGLVATDTGGLILARPNHVTALDAAGQIHWQYDTSGFTPPPPFLTDDGRLVFSAGNRMIALQTDLRPATGGWSMWRADPQRSGRTVVSSRILDLRPENPGSWALSFAGKRGARCWVERSKNLSEWEVVIDTVAEAGVTRVTLDLSDDGQPLFLRIRSETE
jgi:outer membrane protein assembly factor BamB